LTALLFSYWAD